MSNKKLGILLIAGCIIGATAFGLRSIFGLYTIPLSSEFGWDREIFALAIAIQNLAWGMGQPFAGRIVDRFGAAPVFIFSGIVYSLGLAFMSITQSPLLLYTSAGLMIGFAMSGASFTTVLAVFTRITPKQYRTVVLGVGTAAGSLGQFIYAPIGAELLETSGWRGSVLIFSGVASIITILGFFFIGALKSKKVTVEANKLDEALLETQDAVEKNIASSHPSALSVIKAAFSHSSYTLLVLGFFVCGFQLAFITVHWPPYLADRGAYPHIAGWALALIGLFNIFGALGSGIIMKYTSRALLLSTIYTLRAFTLVALVLLPAGNTETLIIASLLGILWLSTVPPTSDLVGIMFGTKNFGMLFGIVFFSHQIGSFAGVWLGAVAFDTTGSYDIVWWAAIVLSLMSALVHLPIKQNKANSYADA